MNTPIFEQLLRLMVQLLSGLERDTSLTWSLRQTLTLDQRFYQIHQNLILNFANDGILMPAEAASRQSDRLFQAFGELMSDLEDDSDVWTATHRHHLCYELRQIHSHFSQLLDDAVDQLEQHASQILTSKGDNL